MIEDNLDILSNNKELLELEGINVLSAESLLEGQALLECEKVDLIILDILLPDGSGLDYCQQLRGESSIPILFLSALNTSEDVVNGLLMGGDGYIVKPYRNSELVAYVHTLLRRNRMEKSPLHIGDIELFFQPRRAIFQDQDLLLNPIEFSLLEYLVRHSSEYISTEELYQKIWGESSDNLRTVHNSIYNLREKINETGVNIIIKRGYGYKVNVTN